MTAIVAQGFPVSMALGLLAFAGGLLVTALLALNFLGDGLRDAWDVKGS